MEMQITKETRRRFRPIFWGIVLVIAAIVLILDGAGVLDKLGYGINVWRIVGGVLLFAWLVYMLVRRQFADVFIPLGLLFLVFEGPIAQAAGRTDGKLLPTWIVIVATILLTVGFSIILKPTHTVSVNGKQYDSNPGKVGNKVLYLEADKLDGTVIHDHLGTVQIYVKNSSAYSSGAVVTITNNMGKVVLHLPDDWDVVTQSGDNIGVIDIPAHTGSGEKNITLVVRDNLGNIEVAFDCK
ncbi:MAG: hypothetical protein E7680_03685 [Ruminococcaceae bacterium]|nr:hypothetical protein [Oscillospiraceae bacterium]